MSKNDENINVLVIMKAILIIPIEKLRGMLRKDGYYFRIYKGTQVVQRCPTKWKDTPARKAAREKFAQTWGKRYKRDNEG
jgi:hypothetical protein